MSAEVNGQRAELMDTRALADELQVSIHTLNRWCAARIWEVGELPPPIFLGPGTRYGTNGRRGRITRRWRRSTVLAWLAEREAKEAA